MDIFYGLDSILSSIFQFDVCNFFLDYKILSQFNVWKQL